MIVGVEYVRTMIGVSDTNAVFYGLVIDHPAFLFILMQHYSFFLFFVSRIILFQSLFESSVQS